MATKKLIGAEKLVKIISKEYDTGYQEFDQSKGLTVEALCHFCIEEILKGNGQKHIQISMDDEGNAYHTLFYGFAENTMDFADENFHDDVDLNDCVILG